MNPTLSSLERAEPPQHILAGVELLQFQSPSTDRLALLTEAERRRFLTWCDNRQLTLLLPHICSSPIPAWLNQQTSSRRGRYERRYQQLKQELFEIVEAFSAEDLQFVMLKGLSHAPAFTPDALFRAQGDIDLWLIGPSVYKAEDVLRRLRYVPLLKSKSRHLPPMARPTGWQWRGDLFDPEMPISVELHYELWSDEAEHISIPQLHRFWDRRQIRDFDGYRIPVLCDADLLGFACLHLFLHLLHGDLPLQRAWEIARFLQNRLEDDDFWASWRASHTAALRAIETCIFSLLANWFGCGARAELASDVQQLPAGARLWLSKFSLAPLRSEWAPNKSEVWLHCAFVQKRRDKARVLLRRLLPPLISSFAERPHLRTVVNRLGRHLVTFFPTVLQGLRWLWLHN